MQIVSICDPIGTGGFLIPSEYLFEYRQKFFLSTEGAIELLKAMDIDIQSLVDSVTGKETAREFLGEYYNNVEPKYQIT